MSTFSSQSNADLYAASTPFPALLKSAGDAVLIPFYQSDTPNAGANIVTTPGEQANGKATKENTQDQRLCFYTKDGMKKIKQDLY